MFVGTAANPFNDRPSLEAHAICCPFGDQSGLKYPFWPNVNCWRTPVSMSTMNSWLTFCMGRLGVWVLPFSRMSHGDLILFASKIPVSVHSGGVLSVNTNGTRSVLV